jgi:hypothetical protein
LKIRDITQTTFSFFFKSLAILCFAYQRIYEGVIAYKSKTDKKVVAIARKLSADDKVEKFLVEPNMNSSQAVLLSKIKRLTVDKAKQIQDNARLTIGNDSLALQQN